MFTWKHSPLQQVVLWRVETLALLQKQVEERKKQLEEMRIKKLKARYGVDFTKKDEAPDVITTENYVEYDRKGNVVKGMAEVREGRETHV